MTTTVILDEQDTDRILRLLYNGSRPKLVHTLICACGVSADLRESASAWDGWQILPFARCPCCLARRPQESQEQPYPLGAHAQFAIELIKRRARKEGV